MSRPSLNEHDLRGLMEPLLGRSAAYAFSLLGNREDAEDAVQEAVWKAYRARARYDRSRSFKAWWFAILRNCCLDLQRRQAAQPRAAPVDPAELAGGDQAVWDQVGRRELLRWALAQLPPSQREIIELHYFGDCSYREIAAALGIPVGTVMSRLHSARQALVAICGEKTDEAS